MTGSVEGLARSGGVPGERVVAPVSVGRIPDFFIVGHPKCGTTALYEMLRRHPQIYMPELKEPRFFAPDLRARFLAGGALGPVAAGDEQAQSLPQTREQYVQLFAPARPDQVVGEASPSYLMSSNAPSAIAAAQPRARIVALLREPVAFLRSLQLELVRNHVELERDFERAIANESIPAIGEGTPDYSPPIRRYSDRIRYVEQLRRFHEAFPAEQVLVLIYEDFRRDNAGTLRQVLAFLGVDPGVALEPSQANPTMDVRSVGLDRLVQAMYGGRGPLARGARRTIRTLAPRRLRGRGFQALRRRLLYAPPKAPPEDFALRLRARFRPEVVALSDYLGRDLVSEWGYGRVG